LLINYLSFWLLLCIKFAVSPKYFPMVCWILLKFLWLAYNGKASNWAHLKHKLETLPLVTNLVGLTEYVALLLCYCIYGVTIDGVWILDQIYWTLGLHYLLTTLYISLLHARSSVHSVNVFPSHYLIVASNDGRSPSSGFPSCAWLQRPTPHNDRAPAFN
jgi:hypothetical protein